MEEFEGPAQRPDVNFTAHLWDEYEFHLYTRSHTTTQMLLWPNEQIPTASLQNLVESLFLNH